MFTSICQSSVIIDIKDIGNNVVASGSGTLNINGLTPQAPWAPYAGVLSPYTGGVIVGPGGILMTGYGLVNIAPIGIGFNTYANSGTGDTFGLTGGPSGSIYVPSGYTSGALLNGTTTWLNTTLAAQNLINGTYKTSWGSGPTADFLTVNIGPQAVPEPSTYALLCISLGCIGYARKRMVKRANP